MNREEWLQAMVAKLRPIFEQHGANVPEVHVSVGFPSKGALALKVRRVGECWSAESSTDGKPHILITPLVAEAGEAAGILVHEMTHAALGKGVGHKAPFKRLATAVGMTGKMTTSTVGDNLKATLAQFIEQIGPYPHAALSALPNHKKQGTRMLKLECPEDGYVVRTTAKWLAVGVPSCPCGIEMVPAGAGEEEGE